MVSPKKVPAGLGKSQQDAVGLQSLLDQSEARTGYNAGDVPVAANMGGRKRRKTRRKTRRKRRKTRRKRRKTRRKTIRKTKRKRRRR